MVDGLPLLAVDAGQEDLRHPLLAVAVPRTVVVSVAIEGVVVKGVLVVVGEEGCGLAHFAAVAEEGVVRTVELGLLHLLLEVGLLLVVGEEGRVQELLLLAAEVLLLLLLLLL